MSHKSFQLDLKSLLAGAAIGAGIVLARNLLAQRDPDHTPTQQRINKALDHTLQEARKESSICLGIGQKYIIFSDHHKGAHNPADDFQQCEATYLTALDYYLAEGYTLIDLGDVEELLEEEIPAVIQAYDKVLRSEARFHPDRYIRIHGNHDDAWEVPELVAQFLHPFFPGLNYRRGVVFKYMDDTQASGEIFLVHGHQGTLDSDLFAFMGHIVLPYYRNFQILTGWGRTLPSKDDCLRASHDTHMYRWASRQGKLILIAGHTHRPVWSSLTHLEKLVWQLHALQQLKPEDRPADYVEKVAQLKQEIQVRQEKYPPCSDTIKTRPCYFNTGCCRFKDGDITGIEIENGPIRLIKWGVVDGKLTRLVLEENTLSEIFYLL